VLEKLWKLLATICVKMPSSTPARKIV